MDGFNEDNWSALMVAVQEGHADTAELLIRRGTTPHPEQCLVVYMSECVEIVFRWMD